MCAEAAADAGDVDAVLDFWFEGDPASVDEAGELIRKWFVSSESADAVLAARFGALAAAAVAGELDTWSATPRGRLALIILLDQLPRNLHRGTAAAFAGDAKALKLCVDGLHAQMPAQLAPLEQVFFFMPLQHAESRETQALAAQTFERLAAADVADPIAAILRTSASHAAEHRAIIEQFGRFPHRNQALGRQSTEAELKYLESGAKRYGQ